MAGRRVVVISHACVLAANQALYAHLAALGTDVHVIAPNRWRPSTGREVTAEALPDLVGCYTALPVALRGHLHLHWYRGLAGALRAVRPDLVCVDEDPPSVVTAQAAWLAQRRGCGLVISLKQNLPRAYPPPFNLIERRAFAQAEAALAASATCLEVARGKGFAAPALVTHYAIDTDHFTPGPGNRSGAGPVVGFAGRLVAAKGVVDLIAAVARLQESMPVRLAVAGDGPEAERLQALARQYLWPGSYVFQPTRSHWLMPGWYRDLDVLVLPSRTTPTWQEQFGRVLAEAQACGTPVVASDAGYGPELVAATGNGLVFPEGDVNALADSIARVLGRPPAVRAELARQGRRAVIEAYGCRSVAARLHEFLQSL